MIKNLQFRIEVFETNWVCCNTNLNPDVSFLYWQWQKKFGRSDAVFPTLNFLHQDIRISSVTKSQKPTPQYRWPLLFRLIEANRPRSVQLNLIEECNIWFACKLFSILRNCMRLNIVLQTLLSCFCCLSKTKKVRKSWKRKMCLQSQKGWSKVV